MTGEYWPSMVSCRNHHRVNNVLIIKDRAPRLWCPWDPWWYRMEIQNLPMCSSSFPSTIFTGDMNYQTLPVMGQSWHIIVFNHLIMVMNRKYIRIVIRRLRILPKEVTITLNYNNNQMKRGVTWCDYSSRCNSMDYVLLPNPSFK